MVHQYVLQVGSRLAAVSIYFPKKTWTSPSSRLKTSDWTARPPVPEPSMNILVFFLGQLGTRKRIHFSILHLDMLVNADILQSFDFSLARRNMFPSSFNCLRNSVIVSPHSFVITLLGMFQIFFPEPINVRCIFDYFDLESFFPQNYGSTSSVFTPGSPKKKGSCAMFRWCETLGVVLKKCIYPGLAAKDLIINNDNW